LPEKRLQHIKATLGKLEKYGNDREEELVEKYGVSLYRIAWRRRKIDDMKHRDPHMRLLMFEQEYATTWSDCFVEGGRVAFDRLGLAELRKQVREPAARGLLRSERKDGIDRVILDTAVPFNAWEEIRVWAAPEPGEQYVIGVDLAIAFESEDADWSVAQVLRRRDRKQVAIYDAKVAPHRFREQLYLLYRWYNNAYLAIETEGNGYSLCRELYDMGARNQYYWKRLDVDIPKITDYLGWETNHKTRGQMQSVLAEAIAYRLPDGKPEPSIILRDEKTVREIVQAKVYPNGMVAAPSNNHDDAMMALMIALMADEDMMNPYRPKGTVHERRELNALVARYGTFGASGDRNRPTLASL